eukprot:gene41025-65020_t
MRILLAEDETDLGNWLTKALAQSDFQVDWVNDGRLVRRSLKTTKYDALILDLGLPGLGGHDVLADLRAGLPPPDTGVRAATVAHHARVPRITLHVPD